MGNLFFIPKSPIKQLTVQSTGIAPGNGLPLFLGYGKTGALSRFDDPIRESFRDLSKRHPSSIGGKAGTNIHDEGGKAMDISAKFVGNFVISGIIRDGSNNPINGCIVKLFRLSDDEFIISSITGADGIFTISLPNDSYRNYYFTTTRTDITGVGISGSISPVQN
jgi:hypothetical protein